MDELITKQLHVVMYKWREYLCQNTPTYISWTQFLDTHKNQLIASINELINPKYSHQAPLQNVLHRNSVHPPDLAVCQSMCYPGDTIIKVDPTHNTGKFPMYIVISACGSILEHTSKGMHLVYHSAVQYPDEIIRLIQSIKHIDRIDHWNELLKDMNQLALYIILQHANGSIMPKTTHHTP
jgi:hypothetical protein